MCIGLCYEGVVASRLYEVEIFVFRPAAVIQRCVGFLLQE